MIRRAMTSLGEQTADEISDPPGLFGQWVLRSPYGRAELLERVAGATADLRQDDGHG